MLKALKKEEVAHIITLVQGLSAKFPANGQVSASGPAQWLIDLYNSPDYSNILKYVSNLSKEAQEELMAVMWVGRDDVEFEQAIEHARENTSLVAQYICGKALSLDEYLSEGLEKIKN